MNKFTRLTALLLALMMILSTFASAETAYQVGDMTQEQWQSIVDNAYSSVGSPTIDTGDSGAIVRPEIPDQPTTGGAPEGKQYLVTTSADLSSGSVNATLYTSGQLVLTGAVADQWQINVGNNVWVNISGAADINLVVTNAMVEGLGTSVQVRQMNTPANVANITIEEYEATMLMVTAVRATEAAAEDTSTETIPVAAADVMTLEEANQYTVVINYRFKGTTTVAANAYTASLGKGTAFNQTVKNPAVVGYKTEVDVAALKTTWGDLVTYDATTDSIVFNVTSIDQNMVVYVDYVPAEVSYTVIHWRQNVENDDYTQYETTTSTGLTGELVPETDVARTYEGFYNLIYERPEIAADGSTIVEVYYDRYYYLLMFDLDGGYGVAPVYNRYGATVPVVGTPTKAGYAFVQWNEVDASGNVIAEDVTIPTTIPATHKYYKAVWTEAETTFTVTYWLENPNWDGETADEEYLYWGSVSHGATTGDTEYATTYESYNAIADDLDTYEMRYSTYNEEKTDAGDGDGVVVAGDGSTVLNVYYDRNEYTLKFYYAMYASNNYYVIGGSTYYFGTIEEIDGNEDNALYLMQQYFTGGNHIRQNRGQVQELPTLNDEGVSRKYTSSYDTLDNRRYYYIAFTAKYGADISQMWPSNVFNSVTAQDWDANTWTGTEAFVSAWNGEHNVYYTQNNSNQTIKGNYTELDYQLLWDYDQFNDSPEVDFLCFWENGADIGWSIPELYNYRIYVPLLDGETTDKPTRTYNGVTYYERVVYVTIDDSDVDNQTPPAINGLAHIGTESASLTLTEEQKDLYAEGWDMFFYYSREEFDLSFSNYDLGVTTQKHVFEEDISSYETYVPANPASYPAGAYTFAGWYTSPELQDEAKYTFTTMPANNVILYAKWEPVKHDVTFYLTEADLDAGKIYMVDADNDSTTGTEGKETAVQFLQRDHGSFISREFVDLHLTTARMQEKDENAPYVFVGWFYKDANNVEQPFAPTMPITQDMKLYGKWSSNVLVPYTIRYVLQGTETKVADDTIGSKLAGLSETFEAKGADQLYTEYQSGYFPTVASQNHIFVTEEAADGVVITFEYTQPNVVPYTVYYVTTVQNAAGTLTEVVLNGKTYYQLLDPKEVKDNDKAVVTENFEVVPGYMPDAFQKRLVVTPNGDNKIIFIYTVDTEHAYYQVTHYIENLTPDTWTEYSSSQIQGTIGDREYVDNPMEISGFTYIKTEYVYDDGTTDDPVTTPGSPDDEHPLDEYGLQINLYYERNSYPYLVRYLEQGSNDVLHDPKAGTGLYGETISEDSISIDGYTCVTASPQSISIRIEEDEDGNTLTTPLLNIITFYYTEDQVTINYVPSPEAGGTVSLGSETIGMKTGVAQGSTATANEHYTFKGWYTNQDCTSPVTADNGTLSEDGRTFVPTKDETELWTSATYYAKFEENDATINYVAVGPTDAVDFGSVNPTSETIKVLTGTATGSTATAGAGYTFVGWYDNAECSGDVLSEDAQYTPTKTEGEAWVDGTTYYAKFVENEVTYTYIAAVKNADGSIVQPSEVGGLVDLNDNANSPASTEAETVKMKTGTAVGATAEPNTNYKFVGWYSDAGCTTLISTADSYVPGRDGTTNLYQGGTYYALFELDVADLTITKTVFDATYTAAPTTDRFTIQVEFTFADGAAKPTKYTLNNGTETNITWGTGDQQNIATFTDIANGDVIVIKDVVIDTGYTVSETDMPNYTETINAYGQTSIQAPNENSINNKVDVTNQYLTGSLTITKELSEDSTPDNESFIFHVTGPNSYEAYVTISGAGSVTLTNLKLGTYTVEETSWSFRYTPTGSTSVTAELTQTSPDKSVSFTNSEKPEKWLHDEYSVHNDFSTPGTYGDTSSTN